ncbi:unnamed protein product [Symbiodinium sp. CCMP2592]|nr:unnamed protein product [Symbiodinium sp. CCMP2592]
METCPAAAIVVEGVVVRVEDVRQVDRAAGDSVSVLSFLLADATGVIAVEVWGNDASRLAGELDRAIAAADSAENGPLFAGFRLTQANIASPGHSYHALKMLKVGRSTRVESLGPRNADAVPWAALPAVTNLTLLRSCSLPILVSELGLQGVVCSSAKWKSSPAAADDRERNRGVMWVIFKMNERLDQHKGRAGAQCAYNRLKTALSAEDVACVDRVTAAGPDRIKFFLKNEGEAESVTPVGPSSRASTAFAETAELVDKGFTITVHLTRPLDIASVEAAKQRLKHSMGELFSEIYKVMLPGPDETTAIDVRFRSTDVRDDVIAHLQEELGPVSLWTDSQHEKRVQQDQNYRARMEAAAGGLVSAREALPALDRWVQNLAGV